MGSAAPWVSRAKGIAPWAEGRNWGTAAELAFFHLKPVLGYTGRTGCGPIPAAEPRQQGSISPCCRHLLAPHRGERNPPVVSPSLLPHPAIISASLHANISGSQSHKAQPAGLAAIAPYRSAVCSEGPLLPPRSCPRCHHMVMHPVPPARGTELR